MFTYKSYMPTHWEYNNQKHQLDPTSQVPDPKNKEILVPLYTLLGMSQDEAKIISTPWKLQQVREYRDLLIAQTDWWVLADRTPTKEQLAYRQALRDITKQTDLDNLVWPNLP